MNTTFRTILLAGLLCWSPVILASGDHKHEQEDTEHADEHGDSTQISDNMAHRVGLGIAEAGPANIERELKVYGRLATLPDKRARVRARFPGVIVSVQANLGEEVKQGDVLATIESNESLQTYQLRAPISGVIHQRTAQVGDLTGETVLFELINVDKLWAELKVFPRQRLEIRSGQHVLLYHGDDVHEGKILHLTPQDDGEPYVLARVALANENHHAAPGDMISAAVVVESVDVSLSVDNRALQELEGRPVVFVQEGESYEARPIRLGRKDDRRTEVLEGLSTGERYVVENSYLIKADIGKSAAAHDH